MVTFIIDYELNMTYLGARLSFRYNCCEALKLSGKLEFNRPFGSYFIVSVVYCLYLPSWTFVFFVLMDVSEEFASPLSESLTCEFGGMQCLVPAL